MFVLQLFRKRKDKFPMHLEQTYLRYMTFVIESAIQNMKNGQEQWIWVLDLAGQGNSLQAVPCWSWVHHGLPSSISLTLHLQLSATVIACSTASNQCYICSRPVRLRSLPCQRPC
jgi:hypothetical protein